ncbi:SNF2 family N-terminal domain-containing protein [Collybia nuda]|uniref:SNF2 family N-terminal domain-containing protein n=1 Tax=Collybia nuda TaxID=64659 RepID=A0A9P5Y7P5_9AGAR|nr:SNF2 family N-terminal domain-containing protein [Collybia nuda]
MEPPSPEQLLAVAKAQLGLSNIVADSYVPKVYLDELKLHLSLYPHDTNFRIKLEPNRGLGKVVCLEQGCDNLSIALVRRVKMYDGGKSDGLGSLSAYRYHIAEHPTHAKTRLTRVKAEKNGVLSHAPSSTLISIKRAKSSLVDLLDGSRQPPIASGSKPTPTSTPLRSERRVSSLVRVKPEPLDAETSQKRLLDVAFGADPDRPSGKSSFPHPPLSKKLKAEPSPKTPLSRINCNTGSSESVEVSKTQPPSLAVEDIRDNINKLQTRISTHQSLLDRLNRKRKKTKADLTRMTSYTRQIDDWRMQKNELNSSIPSMSSMTGTLSRTQAVSGVRYDESLTSLSVPPAYNTFNRLPITPSVKTTIGPMFTSNNLARPPVGQSVKSEIDYINFPLPPAFHNPIFAPPIVKQQEQPVASGSNVPLHDYEEPFGVGMDMDLDIYRGPSEDEYDPYKLPTQVLQQIGPVIPYLPVLQGIDHHDENGDYHGRGRDLFRGPEAKADDIDKFLLEAGNAEQFDGNASVDQALEKLGLRSQYDLIPGMEVALMPHQTIGVAWMLEKEQSSLKGGCLGDDMGLGKTIQMIAVLVKNRSDDLNCKTNLIIAPTALLDQWKLEIEMKTNCNLNCLIYHGSSKPKGKQELLKYDVVLTTYTTMALEWPDFEAEIKKKEKAKRKKAKGFIVSDSDEDSEDRPRKRNKESGLLFQVDFLRVILDEAQAVRNRRTRTSRAVTSLRAKYRWCLTGTPIVNSLVDTYGYLRFLMIRPWYDFKHFHGDIGSLEKKNPTLAVSRLQAVIATFLLRRMKDSLLDGKRLIELPDKTISLVRLEFSTEEREIYTTVESRTQAKFNRYLRAGTVLKNYSQVLVLLLRLRQICSHPSLIQENEAAFVSPDEVDNCAPEMSTELTRARRLVSPDFVSKMKARFKAAALQRMEAEKESADAVVEDEECPICFDALTDAVITPCTHTFCRDCLVGVLNTPFNTAPDEPTKFKGHERPCPSCRSPISQEKLFTREAFQPSDKDLAPAPESSSEDVTMTDVTNLSEALGKRQGVKRKRASRRLVLDSDDGMASEAESEEEEVDDDIKDFIVQSDEDEEEKDAHRNLRKRLGKRRAIVIDSDDEIEDSPEDKEVLFGVKKAPVSGEPIKLMARFLPSTKMKFMMKQLEKLLKERPEEKTLVVSQWTGCLQLVSDYLTEAGVIHVKYQGDMNRAKRDQAVRVFMSKDKARVMLMSLKCGGVGLNLTRANNVISLDLGWSQAIEAQSFDRVHRLGQTRPVVVQRLVIADTVEDRVLTMQERKQTLADGSLGEGKGKKIGKLSVKELASLFGLDHRGRLLTN